MEYRTPELTKLGSLTELTLGHGGSSLDGSCLTTQRGKGNDGTNPHGYDPTACKPRRRRK